jgi:hypothetical protein
MGFDEFSNDVEFLWRKAAILAEINRLQPKFTNQFIPLHMDVFRFAAIEAVKEEAIRARDVFDGWHLFLILRSRQPGSWSNPHLILLKNPFALAFVVK